MGKASTAKKVQRAARAGGKKQAKQRQLGFPLAIAAVVILGLGLVVYARSSGVLGSDAKNSPKVGEHWHSSYGFYVCDHFVANIPDGPTDLLGIHTHEDGLVHIHPFSTGAAGKQATFARFFDQTGMKVSDTEIKLPKAKPFSGRTYKEGETTCNGKPAQIQVSYWKDSNAASQGAKPDKVYTKDFSKIRFAVNFSAYTFAFVPKGTKVPPPPGSGQITENATVDSGAQPTSSSDTTLPIIPETGTTSPTTAPSGSTTAPASTAPETTAPATTAPATTAAP